MHDLNEAALLTTWERGLHLHPIDRALTLIAMAFPDMSHEQLAELSKGERDERLLRIRERLFGDKISGAVRCKACEEQLEIEFHISQLRADAATSQKTAANHIQCDSYRVTFRPLNSLDLALIVGQELSAAKRILINRCILKATRNKKTVSKSRLPKRVLSKLSQKLSEIDPYSEIQLELNCGVCQHNWQVDFDILSFFWVEISMRAQALMHEVHRIAMCYGWTEREILSLSPIKRRFYLESVG